MEKTLGIYLHIPFCRKKCRYCDFLSFYAETETQKRYIERMAEEIRRFPNKEKWKVKTVFFGGGTPSLVEADQTAYLLETIRQEFNVEKEAEVSIECNPGTVDGEKLASYKDSGINRISFGLQSAKETELKLLGRIHTYQTFLESYQAARKCGFQNINVDLMSGLPGQTAQSFLETLECVVALNPEHISAYSLMIEPGTPFYNLYAKDLKLREAGKECFLLPSEEEERQMYHDTKSILKKSGYFRYEISNYAKDGYECRHNMTYWERKDYAGFGLGAAACIENVRSKNTEDLQAYMQGNFKKEEEKLDIRAQMEEFLFLGLRMIKGVCSEEFFKQFGVSLESVYGTVLEKLIKEELLEQEKSRYRLSDFGIDVSNYVLAQFLQ